MLAQASVTKKNTMRRTKRRPYKHHTTVIFLDTIKKIKSYHNTGNRVITFSLSSLHDYYCIYDLIHNAQLQIISNFALTFLFTFSPNITIIDTAIRIHGLLSQQL
jgi:hypothetical protein